jgi:hypothetical protein
VYSDFQSDKTNNPTNILFDVLGAQSPDLEVKNLREKLTELGLNNVLEVLKKSGEYFQHSLLNE